MIPERYQGIDFMLEMLEKRIDPAHCEYVEKLHDNAIHFREVPRIPLSVEYPVDESLPVVPYIEAFHDFEKMLYHELAMIDNNVWNSVRIQDDYPLQIRPNYGIGVISSLFGAEIQIRNTGMPWVKAMEEETFKKVISKGVPDIHGGLAPVIMEAYERFAEMLSPYPKCAKAIRLTQPDMQGPFDNLHLLRGSDVFYDLYEDPELIHEALDVISDTMILFQKSLPKLNDRVGEDGFYIHRAVYRGGALLKLDTETAMISGEMYKEFCRPRNSKILNAFGGGSLHFCGGGKKWPSQILPEENTKCLNFGNPEMQDVCGEWDEALKKGICVVGYGEAQPYDFLEEKLQRGIRTGVTFLMRAQSFEEAKAAQEKHRSGY